MGCNAIYNQQLDPNEYFGMANPKETHLLGRTGWSAVVGTIWDPRIHERIPKISSNRFIIHRSIAKMNWSHLHGFSFTIASPQQLPAFLGVLQPLRRQAGWWWRTEHDWLIFPYMKNVIIPIDELLHLFQWDRVQTYQPPTRLSQLWSSISPILPKKNISLSISITCCFMNPKTSSNIPKIIPKYQ